MAPAEPSCAALVLAAGGSSRLGQPKQLVRIAGESLLCRTVRLGAESGFAPIYLVLGAFAQTMRNELQAHAHRLPVITVENPAWETGMGSSLAVGVNRALEHSSPAHLLLLVCDQPRLTADLLRTMREAHLASGTAITAASYAGRLGVPAIFTACRFPELLAIPGDRGARAVLVRYASEVLEIPFPGGEIDVDTREDLAYLLPAQP